VTTTTKARLGASVLLQGAPETKEPRRATTRRAQDPIDIRETRPPASLIGVQTEKAPPPKLGRKSIRTDNDKIAATITKMAWQPLCREPHDQGDPFALRIPDGVEAKFRYYVYCTGEGGKEDGRTFSVYGSNDLEHWERMENNALIADTAKAHWAPSVLYIPGLERPYVMLYSRGKGQGEEAHIGHRILRADSATPEGPFVPSGEDLSETFDFAIDPDVFRMPDGRMMMSFAADFVDQEPYGTGLWMAPISEDLRTLLGPPEPMVRPSADWHVYDAARTMPWKQIDGVDWDRGDKVKWHCMEGPSGGLTSPEGKPVVLYSGGCFFGFYAVGALVGGDNGKFEDASAAGNAFVVQAHPELGIHSTGHCSTTTAPDGTPLLFFHERLGGEDSPRQFTFAPLRWKGETPQCPPPAKKIE
jgi:hypothetical protein